MDLVALFQCLPPHVTTTTLRQCSRIPWAMRVMTGRVTRLGISRWAGKGGSSRTVPRLFATVIPWAMLFWGGFRQHGYRPGDVSLLVGEEVVATQAGQPPSGLARFFASLSGQPVPGLAFFTLAVVRIAPRHAFPIRVEQVGRSDAEKTASQATAPAQKSLVPRPKRRPGRPPGSTHNTKTHVTLTPALVRIPAMIDAVLRLIRKIGPRTSLVLDGHCGHHHALQRARPCALHLIAKLRCDAALSLPDPGPDAGRGPHRKYGRKLDDDHLPGPYLKETPVEGHIQTCLSQLPLLHKECTQPVPIVRIATTNLRPQARAHVVLVSSALALASAPLGDDESLRFPSEWNFRAAQPYGGLEDFMNLTPPGVTHAAQLSVCMVKVSYRLRADVRQRHPEYRLLDWKAACRGSKYVEETIKMLPDKPEPVVLAKMRHKVAGLGRIHALQPCFSFS